MNIRVAISDDGYGLPGKPNTLGIHKLLDEWESTLPESIPSDHDLVTPGVPELFEWVRYERAPLYLKMLKGGEIGIGHLTHEYRSWN